MKPNKITAKKNIKSFAWNRKNVVIASAVVAVVVIGTVWGGVELYGKYQSTKIDLSGKSEEQIRAYMESEEFKKLDREARHQYGRAAMEQAMEKRINGYFEVAPDQRTAYLDKMIDEMQQRRKEMPPREPRPQVSDPNKPGDGGLQAGQGRGGGARRSPGGMRARQESSSPEQRAKRTEFSEAMRNRMKERGINFRPGGGGPGRR